MFILLHFKPAHLSNSSADITIQSTPADITIQTTPANIIVQSTLVDIKYKVHKQNKTNSEKIIQAHISKQKYTELLYQTHQ